MQNWMYRITFAAAAVLLLAGPVAATSLRVSSNGTDSATCGGGANPPCATIGQAVTNATDGDSILVGPGRYAGLTVTKAVRLSSANGTGGAIITSQMTLGTDGIVFGKPGKGFSLNPGSGNSAVVVTGNAVTVRGNVLSDCMLGIDVTGNDAVVRDNSFDGCTTAIRIAGSGAQVRGNRSGYAGIAGVVLESASSGADVRENRMYGPSGVAIVIGGSDHLVRRNLIHGTPGGGFTVTGVPTGVQLLQNVVVSSSSPAYNLSAGNGWVLIGNAAFNNNAPGFYLTAGSTFTVIGNVAIGNATYGMFVSNGNDHVLKDNTAIDNQGDGILVAGSGTGVGVSGGNLYGNTSNCGLYNSSPNPVTADKVYWGAASGTGLDPADDVCGNIAAVTVTNPAAKAASIKLPAVK